MEVFKWKSSNGNLRSINTGVLNAFADTSMVKCFHFEPFNLGNCECQFRIPKRDPKEIETFPVIADPVWAYRTSVQERIENLQILLLKLRFPN